LFLSCVCVSVSGVLFSVGVCVCDLSIFLHKGKAVRDGGDGRVCFRWFVFAG